MPVCLKMVVVFALAVMVTMVDARLLDRNTPLAVLLQDGEVTHISNRFASKRGCFDNRSTILTVAVIKFRDTRTKGSWLATFKFSLSSEDNLARTVVW